MNFKPKVLILVIIFTTLIPYLIWSFVALSFLTPINVIKDDNFLSITYRIYVVACIIVSIPGWLPHKEDEQNEK